MRTMLMAAVAVLGVGAAVFGPSVEAAPAVSPFAGDYTGRVYEPFDSTPVWGSISISSSGKIAGAKPEAWLVTTGKFSGSVAANGTYALSGSYQWRWPHGADNWIHDVLPAGVEIDEAGAKDSAVANTNYFQSAGTLTRGADGNLYGTTTSGATFVWTRK